MSALRDKLHAMVDAVVDEIERAHPITEKPATVPRSRRRRAPEYPAPLRPPSDLDRKRAEQMLRRRGIR